MPKPPITIKCECGEKKELAYGERWSCGRCRRVWNTAQIPPEEYDGLLRRVRRRKLEAVVAAALLIAVIIPALAFGGTRFLGLIPLVMAAWLFLYLPYWRRRVHAAARSAPQWELRPE